MPITTHVFTDGDVPLAAHVHRDTDDPFEPRPGVVLAGSWLTVKEQMADHYAAELAARGYTAITFDYAGFGESGGGLRQAELPLRKASNLAAAVRWASSLSWVAPGGPGLVAVCASAQYALAALAAGTRVRSFASVAGWYHDAASVGGFYGGADDVRDRLARGSAAAAAVLRGEEPAMAPAYAPGDDRAGMSFELDYYGNAGRGAIPQWRNEMSELSWGPWLTFDGLAAAPRVDVPSLFVHSDGCVFPDNARAVAGAITGPVETVWAEGEQIDFYDRPAQTALVVDAVDAHFRTSPAVVA